jgi:site-specific DNA-methyltransferase (adenine-specific)
MPVKLINADCIEAMREMEPDSIDAVVTDPPYDLTQNKKGGTGPSSLNPNSPGGRSRIGTGNGGFMGKDWDATGIAFKVETWAEVLRVAKPGAFLLAFGGTRTFHRMMIAIEDAGWELRDTIMWVHSTGFPKSLDVSKALEAHALTGKSDSKATATGEARDREGLHWSAFPKSQKAQEAFAPTTELAKQWAGWGTALKPSFEPIVVARKPLIGTVAQNVARYGTGAINIDGCRIGSTKRVPGGLSRTAGISLSGSVDGSLRKETGAEGGHNPNLGRWPANFIHDGSEEVLAEFPQTEPSRIGNPRSSQKSGDGWGMTATGAEYNDSGSAARFFYCAKASREDRDEGNLHPTVKPVNLMRYLVRLVTPPKGVVLDPFMGSGSTGIAAIAEGVGFVGIEREPEYHKISTQRIEEAQTPSRTADLMEEAEKLSDSL